MQWQIDRVTSFSKTCMYLHWDDSHNSVKFLLQPADPSTSNQLTSTLLLQLKSEGIPGTDDKYKYSYQRIDNKYGESRSDTSKCI